MFVLVCSTCDVHVILCCLELNYELCLGIENGGLCSSLVETIVQSS